MHIRLARTELFFSNSLQVARSHTSLLLSAPGVFFFPENQNTLQHTAYNPALAPLAAFALCYPHLWRIRRHLMQVLFHHPDHLCFLVHNVHAYIMQTNKPVFLCCTACHQRNEKWLSRVSLPRSALHRLQCCVSVRTGLQGLHMHAGNTPSSTREEINPECLSQRGGRGGGREREPQACRTIPDSRKGGAAAFSVR